jgi:micrococcal nuclease
MRISKLILPVIFIILLILAKYIASNKEEDHEMPVGQYSLVSRVVDGDTIELKGGEKVRYIGIDTPESTIKKECYGNEASEFNKNLVEGKQVRLEKDVSERDRHGRLLRYVYVLNPDNSETFVNEVLVKEGYASSYSYPPDIKNQEIFIESQREARDKKLGLWSACPNQEVQGVSIEDKDCSDFSTQSEAQKFFIKEGGPELDAHNLDRDDNGMVCENLK